MQPSCGRASTAHRPNLLIVDRKAPPFPPGQTAWPGWRTMIRALKNALCFGERAMLWITARCRPGGTARSTRSFARPCRLAADVTDIVALEHPVERRARDSEQARRAAAIAPGLAQQTNQGLLDYLVECETASPVRDPIATCSIVSHLSGSSDPSRRGITCARPKTRRLKRQRMKISRLD